MLKRISDIDWDGLITNKQFFPSPDAWEDEVLYFLLVDRFSDGKEEIQATKEDYGNALLTEESTRAWQDAGGKYCGGTINGVRSKLVYLKRLGINGIWLSPVFKQCAYRESYHGYGIQNFLDIDPHFGTKDDLIALVKEAHAIGIRVILDIIFNHTGDVFGYGTADGDDQWPAWTGETFPVKGFRDGNGHAVLPADGTNLENIAWPDGALWPLELQDINTFTRKGEIKNWDNEQEFLDGDFFSLKDVDVGQGGFIDYKPSHAMKILCACYKYWMVLTDVDGFRLDTVKHIDPGATRYFTTEIHEFGKGIGKNNFYVIGEITGGMAFAVDMLEKTGLDAALGINRIPDKLENAVKGYTNPKEYFDIFRNSELLGEDDYRWYRDKVVGMFDDHDMVIQYQGTKGRFAADTALAQLLPAALFLNVATLGIACIYYGSEQGFDGSGGNDRYIRECMFGGPFGAFRSVNRHFFDEQNPIYQALSAVLHTRAQHLTMRQGRQYFREIAIENAIFHEPKRIGEGRMTGIFAWSLIMSGEEMVMAVNTDIMQPRTAFITIDQEMHQEGEPFHCLLIFPASIDAQAVFVQTIGDRKAIEVTVPPAGYIIWQNKKHSPDVL